MEVAWAASRGSRVFLPPPGSRPPSTGPHGSEPTGALRVHSVPGMDEDVIDLLDVAARVAGLLDGEDRRLLGRFCLQAAVAELSESERVAELIRLGYDLDVLASSMQT